MNKKTMEILEYNKIKDTIKNYALSEIGKAMIDEMEPFIDINIIGRYMDETTEARAIVDRSSSVPLHSLNGIKNMQEKLEKGVNLLPEELELSINIETMTYYDFLFAKAFSSHIKNIISIIECADPYTLVIIDEVGVGTDPGEGMGIATAVLEEMYNKKAIILATTHYSEIKEFAENTPGFKNGCMEFDINTLKPTYKLSIGKAGESNAFNIALRLGMDRKLVERAHFITYKEVKKYSGFSEEIIEERFLDKNTIIAHEDSIMKLKEIEKIRVISEKQKEKPKFNIGDAVFISTMNRTGIVYETENSYASLNEGKHKLASYLASYYRRERVL